MIGYKFFTTDKIVWRCVSGGALPISFPCSGELISKTEAKIIRKRMGLLFLRWEDDFGTSDCVGVWWHVIKKIPDTLSTLPPKTRYMIKKALNKFEARRVDIEVIIKYGYQVYLDSYERYDTNERIYSREEFTTAISQLHENTEWWGVFEKNNNTLVGFSENFVDRKKCFVVSMWHRPESMKRFSSYLHFYEMEKFYLNECGFDYISDGARSINHNTNIHNFLISKFNYQKVYAKLRIVYNPLLYFFIICLLPLRPLINRIRFLSRSKLLIALNQEWLHQKCF